SRRPHTWWYPAHQLGGRRRARVDDRPGNHRIRRTTEPMTATTGISSPQSEGATEAVAAEAQTARPEQELDAATVATWLLKHPQFFRDQPELLMALQIPHESGKAVSLLERQVTLFRERHQQMEAQF